MDFKPALFSELQYIKRESSYFFTDVYALWTREGGSGVMLFWNLRLLQSAWSRPCSPQCPRVSQPCVSISIPNAGDITFLLAVWPPWPVRVSPWPSQAPGASDHDSCVSFSSPRFVLNFSITCYDRCTSIVLPETVCVQALFDECTGNVWNIFWPFVDPWLSLYWQKEWLRIRSWMGIQNLLVCLCEPSWNVYAGL